MTFDQIHAFNTDILLILMGKRQKRFPKLIKQTRHKCTCKNTLY